MIRRAAVVILLWLVASAGGARAQPGPADSVAVARDAISQLRSPFCPGLMLEVCPSPDAGLLRDSIHALAARGVSSDSIVEWMLARHGEEWRGSPKTSGTGLWAWTIPPLVLLLGAGFLVARLRAIRRPAPPPEAPETPISPEERAELYAALRSLEREDAP